MLELYRFLDWFLGLPFELEQEHQERVSRLEKERGVPYVTSAERIGIAKGREEGREEGRAETVTALLTARFGPLPDAVLTGVRASVHAGRFEELVRRAATEESLDGLRGWLAEGLDSQGQGGLDGRETTGLP